MESSGRARTVTAGAASLVASVITSGCGRFSSGECAPNGSSTLQSFGDRPVHAMVPCVSQSLSNAPFYPLHTGFWPETQVICKESGPSVVKDSADIILNKFKKCEAQGWETLKPFNVEYADLQRLVELPESRRRFQPSAYPNLTFGIDFYGFIKTRKIIKKEFGNGLTAVFAIVPAVLLRPKLTAPPNEDLVQSLLRAWEATSYALRALENGAKNRGVRMLVLPDLRVKREAGGKPLVANALSRLHTALSEVDMDAESTVASKLALSLERSGFTRMLEKLYHSDQTF